MNANRIIDMIVRQITRRLVNKGIDKAGLFTRRQKALANHLIE
ncbi:hypothetical protein [Ruegeria sp.]